MKWPFSDEVFHADRVVDYHDPKRLKSAIAFLRGMWVSTKAIRQYRPRLIVSTGPALAVPVCVVGKWLFGIQVVHIESWSRISSISKTTRLLHRFQIADIVVYQYSESILAGQPRCEYWGHL
jgi:UDP-N-acetylglucosamine:LPS N-acetylglucosamine transferase